LDIDPFSLSGEIENFVLSGDSANVNVKRGAGGGDISGVRLIFVDRTGNSYDYQDKNKVPGELEVENYVANDIGDVNEIKEVSLYYIYEKNGKDRFTHRMDSLELVLKCRDDSHCMDKMCYSNLGCVSGVCEYGEISGEDVAGGCAFPLTCDGGRCVGCSASKPCPDGKVCDGEECVECVGAGDCNDDDICTVDSCDNNECSNNPKCPVSEICNVDGNCEQPSCTGCEDCDGFFDGCSYGECKVSCKIDDENCYFRGFIIGGDDCVDLTDACSDLISSCDDYSDEECDSDPCRISIQGGCEMNDGDCVTGPYCGDGTCDDGEDCNSCSGDCGSCSQTCSEQGGDLCGANEYCFGDEIPSDEGTCCDEACRAPADCGDCGWMGGWLCNHQDCIDIGECYFVGHLLSTNDCISCAGASCSDYESSVICGTDDCNIGNCVWDGNSCGEDFECEDEDGGLNYDTFGRAVKGSTAQTDYCLDSINLIEAVCNSEGDPAGTLPYECPNRCEAGACVCESSETDCSDGRDNDCDGKIDTGDVDCIETLMDSSISYWKFDGNFLNGVGNNHGTKQGNAKVDSNVLVLDGNGDYVDLGSGFIELNGKKAFSIGFWMRAGNIPFAGIPQNHESRMRS